MKTLILSLACTLLSASSSFASSCFSKVQNTPELDKITQSMRLYMQQNESSDPTAENFHIETLRWNKSACSKAQFLKAARESNKSATYNWEDNQGADLIENYTGSFFKDYSFDDWFARPDVHIEKDIYNQIYSLAPGFARNLKYTYYSISDGSWAWENGAIVFSENLDTQYKIYFIGHP